MEEKRYTVKSIEAYLDNSIEQNWTKSGINEFDYLLKYISDGKFTFSSSEDLLTIFTNADTLLQKIDEELSKSTMKEEESFKVSHQTAEGNMKDLRSIILSIKEYYENIGFDDDGELRIHSSGTSKSLDILAWLYTPIFWIKEKFTK